MFLVIETQNYNTFMNLATILSFYVSAEGIQVYEYIKVKI